MNSDAYKSSFDAETALLKFEDDLRVASLAQGVIDQEINTLRRQILELEIMRTDLSGAGRKGRENIKRIESEIRTAKTIFWRLRNENL